MSRRPSVSVYADPNRLHALISGVVGGFTPNWFAVTMGTGILALALAQFPQVPWLRPVGEALWLANSLLYFMFAVVLAARFVFDFGGACRLIHHPVMSMFFGCVPMGLATVVNGILLFGVPRFGADAVASAEVLWWLDVALAVVAGLAVPFSMFTRQDHGIERMTAIWLLPLVACGVAAVSGALLVNHVEGAASQMTILMTSMILWSCAVPIALSLLVVLFLRMVLHKLPEAGMAASSWLAIGPIGTGALALMLFSDVAPPVLAANGLGSAAAAFGGAALLGGVLLWAYGLWWLAIATLVTLRYFRSHVPFNLGWWGYTFPLGVYAVATLTLAEKLPFAPFYWFGATLVGCLAAIWALVASRTLAGLWRGRDSAMPIPAIAV
jgi:C4-dicarboxylate transporter/malic acid transport protein